MAAQLAVLHTNELLENIIAYLPPRDIFKAKAVSKRWRDLIKTSQRLRQAQLLVPIKDIQLIDKVPQFAGGGVTSFTPIYEKGASLRENPRLRPRMKYLDGCLISVLSHDTYYWRHDLESYGHEFATRPPCLVVGVGQSRDGASNPHTTTCMVYSKSGVKISDLLFVAKAMAVQDENAAHSWAHWSFGEMKRDA